MKERVCCVYDTDERYAVKLTEAMNRSDKVPYKVMAFSSEEALLDCNRNCEIEMLLTGENIDAQVISEIRSAHIYTLGEGTDDTGNNFINKYQSTERIITLIFAGMKDSGTGCNDVKGAVTVVYSPSSCCFKTTVALAYCRQQSVHKKVLFISFEEFAGLDSFFERQEKDLSEALYYYISKGNDKISKIVECIGTGRDFDYLYPAGCPEDVGIISAEKLFEFVEVIARSGIYKEIVVDMGNLCNNPFEFISRSNNILMPEAIGNVGKENQQKFMDYLAKSRFKNISNRIHIIRLPFRQNLFGASITADMVSGDEITKALQEVSVI